MSSKGVIMSLYYNQMIEDLLNDNELRIYKDKESDLQWEIKDYGTTLVCQQYFPDHSGYYNELLDMNVYYDLDMKQEKSFDILIDLLNKYKDRVLPMYLYAGEGEAEFLHIPYEEASKYDSFKKLTYIAEIFPYVFKVYLMIIPYTSRSVPWFGYVLRAFFLKVMMAWSQFERKRICLM